MKTCDEIIEYIKKNDYCNVYNNFAVSASKIVEILDKDEEVIFASGTSSIGTGMYVHCRKNAVVAITNKRLIYAGLSASMFAVFTKNMYVNSISLEFVSDILYNQNSGGISIDCRNETIIFFTNKKKIVEVYNKINSAVDNIKNTKNTVTVNTELSNADELKKYKELFDSGVITQEEFDAKKKQLLGL